MIKKVSKNSTRKRRHKRVRNKVVGTPDRPRLNVYRSLKHMYAQVIDDVEGNTIASASTLDEDVKSKLESTSNKEAAKAVGEVVAKKAIDKGVKEVTFDRGGYIYHGRVKSIAEGAREGGLKF